MADRKVQIARKWWSCHAEPKAAQGGAAMKIADNDRTSASSSRQTMLLEKERRH